MSAIKNINNLSLSDDENKALEAKKKNLVYVYDSISTSKFFLFFFIVFIIFVILSSVFSTIDYLSSNLAACIAITVITIILWIILELFISVLLVKTKAINAYYQDPENKGLWILFLVGLFIIIPAIAGAFMTISNCNKIISDNQIKKDENLQNETI